MTVHQLSIAHRKIWPEFIVERKQLLYYSIIALYFAFTIYIAVTDVHFQIVWLNCLLLIVISGALIGPRFGVVLSLVLNIFLAATSYLEYGSDRALPLMTTGTIIAGVAWLTNKGIREERDKLELKVEERTRELRNVQIARVAELHRAADNGRLAAGYFHDLMNPLTALALSIQNFAKINSVAAKPINQSLNEALNVSRKMQDFINLMRRQIPETKLQKYFMNQEMEQILAILAYRARKNGVVLEFYADAPIEINYDILQFDQVVSNLISNAIDSYEGLNKAEKRVVVSLSSTDSEIKLEVKDFGVGIPKEVQHKIFDNFYSSKNNGMGLGLSITKTIVELEWGGRIELESSKHGTTFTVLMPRE